MKKISCVFIDHVYHQKTQSTKFLMDLLSQEMNVCIEWINDFSKESMQRIGEIKCDLYVVFQYDFLAAYLLAQGKKVLCVPMYDGTGLIHPAHWALLQDALFLNYSQTLHKRHLAFGLQSISQAYYPLIDNSQDLISYDSTKVFFWERRPSSGLSVLWLAKQIASIKEPIARVHIHLSPDPTEYSSIHPSQLNDVFPSVAQVTSSTWFSSKAKFLENLRQFNVYIAPRVTEGIGFSFLDAMSYGQCVVGLNYPTLNEYVDNGRNGYLQEGLFTPFPNLEPSVIAKLGMQAQEDLIVGRQRWEQEWPITMNRILEYVFSSPSTTKYQINSTQMAELCFYFFNDLSAYLALIDKLLKTGSPRMASKERKIPSRFHKHLQYAQDPLGLGRHRKRKKKLGN